MFLNYKASAFYWPPNNKVHFEAIFEGEGFIPVMVRNVYCYRNIMPIIK